MSNTLSPASVQPSRPLPHRDDAGGGGTSFRQLLMPLASLRITVTLLALSMVLVFAGTWAQIDQGVWFVQKRYFHSLFCWVDFALFLPRPMPGQSPVPGGFPMPGGYLLGLLLLVNLAAAYIAKFRVTWKDLLLLPALALSIFLGWVVLGNPSFAAAVQSTVGWEKGGVYYLLCLFVPVVLVPLLAAIIPLHKKRSGIILIHLGVMLLLVGEGVTSRVQREGQMIIDEGQTVSFAQDSREVELAIVDTSPADHNEAVLVTQKRLEQGGAFHWPTLPFDVKIEAYYPNSNQVGPMQRPEGSPKATAGGAKDLAVVPAPKATGTQASLIDLPSAYISIVGEGGRTLATYLVSTVNFFDLKSNNFFMLRPQSFAGPDGKVYTIQLRFRREYKPYSLSLIKFSHDVYTGTKEAKNFSSRLRLTDPSHDVDREVLIRMNEPLRYNGETFYQSSFIGDSTTILQVVRNPGWLMPYVACTVGGAGLMTHFGLTLSNFLRKKRKSELAKAQADARLESKFSPWDVGVPAAIAALFALVFISRALPHPIKSDFDLTAFSKIPLSFEGRTLPMDSLARNSLKVVAERESITIDKKRKPPVEWLLDTMARPEVSDAYPVFRVENMELQALLHLPAKAEGQDPTGFWSKLRAAFIAPPKLLYSVTQIRDHMNDFAREAERADKMRAGDRGVFEKKTLEFSHKLSHYLRLGRRVGSLYLVPPVPGATAPEWRPLGDVLQEAQTVEQADPVAVAFVGLLDGYNQQDPTKFNDNVKKYAAELERRAPVATRKAAFESWFNAFDPFTNCIVAYVTCFILGVCSWIGWSRPLARSAFWLLLLTLAVHTVGLAGRVYISGRPPVTNLASSAIFIAWGGVILAAGLEFVNRNAIGTVAAAAIGFGSLVISDRLQFSQELSPTGDTMQVMQAVLDTNFWLATHVVTVTLGYAATALAGFIAILYVLLGLCTRVLRDKDAAKQVIRMVYGVVCFGMLFSFIGTILGGIWADQSWGRFWGWDPKENGAVLIVLWNAIILHARWGGIVRDRGLACLAIFGNCVVAWSYFGTNMLGVGLHSYGFMDSALPVLVGFILSQLALIAVGNIPLRFWRSNQLPA